MFWWHLFFFKNACADESFTIWQGAFSSLLFSTFSAHKIKISCVCDINVSLQYTEDFFYYLFTLIFKWLYIILWSLWQPSEERGRQAVLKWTNPPLWITKWFCVQGIRPFVSENPTWVYPCYGTYKHLTDSFVLYEITSLLEHSEFAFLAWTLFRNCFCQKCNSHVMSLLC